MNTFPTLAKQLSDIGLCLTTNKSLRSFVANGASGNYVMQELLPAICSHPNITYPNQFASALIIANKYLNGGQITGLRDMWMTPKDQVDYLKSHPDRLYDTYRKTKRSTLEQYRKATITIERVSE